MRLPIESIGHKIRMIRKERGFTLEIMAGKTGLSKGLLSQVERGYPNRHWILSGKLQRPWSLRSFISSKTSTKSKYT